MRLRRKVPTLIVGMDRNVTTEQAVAFKERLNELGIDAVVITGVTSLAVVKGKP